MPNRMEDFMDLVKQGRIKEAQAVIEAEKVRCKYEPDTIISVDGKPPRFTKKGKPVELDEDGHWRLKSKS